ncbi:hypothetical protein [Proteiniborus sp. MB09-C3]|nr:hypothetical protein [Proteiniborus sp. MB09-C3]WIV12698.1 hypothetical protein QO263_03005 [Proteiniborus sp. MB09-C3]
MKCIRSSEGSDTMGLGAGINGGRKVFEGSYEDFLRYKDSRTSPYLK